MSAEHLEARNKADVAECLVQGTRHAFIAQRLLKFVRRIRWLHRLHRYEVTEEVPDPVEPAEPLRSMNVVLGTLPKTPQISSNRRSGAFCVGVFRIHMHPPAPLDGRVGNI